MIAPYWQDGTGRSAWTLTERERIALHAKAIGLSHQESVRRLGATQKTFQRALLSATAAMSAATPTEAVALAVHHGLIDPTQGVLGDWPVRPYTRRTDPAKESQ
jgi:hypothetical protein